MSIAVSQTQACTGGRGINRLSALLRAQRLAIQQQRLAIGGGGLGSLVGGGAPLTLVPSVITGTTFGGLPGIAGLGGIGGIGAPGLGDIGGLPGFG